MRRLSLPAFVAGALLAASAAAKDRGPQIGSNLHLSVGVAAAQAHRSAVTRGGAYMGFPERFNRYYTDPAWKPSRTLYVSPTGSGDGATRSSPMSVRAGVAAARPGRRIYFVRGKYKGCFEFAGAQSGTYDNPVLVYGERNADGSIGAAMTCCNDGRRTCFNLEAANYIAVDGFELIGGGYGVRAVGVGYPASQHSRGVAVLNSHGHDQDRDPFFSGQVDWAVWEGNVAHGAGDIDGHGIYLSNGSDWNVVRYNETYSNSSSDFQINADPNSTCLDEGIPFSDPRCDAYAGTGEGGRGASDYFLLDANYFHHSDGPGANFTSVRRSVVRNNVFGPSALHNVSFWQETSNPKLGSRENKIINNLFITTDRHGVQFIENSTRNAFVNNVLLGIKVSGGTVTANPSATLMEVDGTVGANTYDSNLYVSGTIDGRSPNAQEFVRAGFSPGWYRRFPIAVNHAANDFTPTATAPFLAKGPLSAYARRDRNGTVRSAPVDLGPIERP
jgi:hypothetical protein